MVCMWVVWILFIYTVLVCSLEGNLKPLAITLGDPAGIGPEVAAKVLADAVPVPPWLLVGTRWALERGAQAAGVTLPEIPTVREVAQLDSIGLVDIGIPQPADFTLDGAGRPRADLLPDADDAAASRYSGRYQFRDGGQVPLQYVGCE